MSEVKTNEPVKQEGEFKLKTKKKTPKKLNETKDNITKVNVNPKEPLIELEPEVKKVIIPKQEEKRRCHSNRRNKGGICGRTIRR